MMILELIKLKNSAAGPFALSGGVMHKITDDTAQAVASGIAAATGSWALGADGVKVVCAFVDGESRFDPDAINPNLELAPNHAWPSPEIEAAHTDYGLCQVNGNGSYLGIGAIKESLDYLCAEIITNLTWAAAHHLPPEVAYEAYNKGRTGALAVWRTDRRSEKRLQFDGVNRRVKDVGSPGDIKFCDYGRVVAARIDEYAALGVV